MFPATGKGTVLDCGHALVAGYRCSLGTADYAPLTADLRKFDKKECTVSSVGQPLKAPDGSIRLEVACSDGLPGYMMTFTDPTDGEKEAVGCTFAGSCVLPTNKPKAKAFASSRPVRGGWRVKRAGWGCVVRRAEAALGLRNEALAGLRPAGPFVAGGGFF